MSDLFYLAIIVIIYGIYVKAKNRRIPKQKMEIQTPLLKQNIKYSQEFVQDLPSSVFSFMFGNSDPWINRFSIDRQPRDLQEKKKEKEQQEESQRIRSLAGL